jgi:potassium-transporting ATPase potassium-binding subunit
MLYAYTSAVGNNGSAFAGINANTPYFNVTIGFAMLIGRFLMMIPLLAAAGSLAQKKQVPVSAGTFPTHGPLSSACWWGRVIVGALTSSRPCRWDPSWSTDDHERHGRLWS